MRAIEVVRGHLHPALTVIHERRWTSQDCNQNCNHSPLSSRAHRACAHSPGAAYQLSGTAMMHDLPVRTAPACVPTYHFTDRSTSQQVKAHLGAVRRSVRTRYARHVTPRPASTGTHLCVPPIRPGQPADSGWYARPHQHTRQKHVGGGGCLSPGRARILRHQPVRPMRSGL